MFRPPDGQPYCAAVDKRDKGHGDEGRKQKPDPEIHDRFDHASEIPIRLISSGVRRKVQLLGAEARPNKGKKRASVTGSRRLRVCLTFAVHKPMSAKCQKRTSVQTYFANCKGPPPLRGGHSVKLPIETV